MVAVGVMRLGELRIQAERLFEFAAGFGGLPRGVQRLRQVVMQAGGPRSALQGAPEVAHGAGSIAFGEAAFGENGERPAVRLCRRGVFEQRDSSLSVPAADDERGAEI